MHDGDPQDALQHLQAAQTLLQESQQTLDDVLKSRGSARKSSPSGCASTHALREEAMGQYEAFESELKRSFAASSWQAVAGNLAQARSLLGTFDSKALEVTTAASQQKYLLGSAC